MNSSKQFKDKEQIFDLEVYEKQKEENPSALSFADSSLNQSNYSIKNAKNLDFDKDLKKKELIVPSEKVQFMNVFDSHREFDEENTHREEDNSDKEGGNSKDPQHQMNDQTPKKFPLVAKNEQNVTSTGENTKTSGLMPYLYVDVNITDTEMSTIEVFEGNKAETLGRFIF